MALKNKITAQERKDYRDLLLKRREEIIGTVDHLENKTLIRARRDASGDLSAVPTHMADVASDNYDQEIAYGLLQNERDELKEIDAALRRIETHDFGLCEICSKPIPKSRLRALPYARLCIQCKTDQENGHGGC